MGASFPKATSAGQGEAGSGASGARTFATPQASPSESERPPPAPVAADPDATPGSGGFFDAVVGDFVRFTHTRLPDPGAPARTPAILVKGTGYLALVGLLALPYGLFVAATTGDLSPFLAGCASAAVFVLVLYAYPAYARGERWSLPALSIIGFLLILLGPLRFLTDAASHPDVAAAPISTPEWIVIFAGVGFLYFLLSPESREGMRQARRRLPAVPGRYVCPECGRVFRLRRLPAPGTLCPSCRRRT